MIFTRIAFGVHLTNGFFWSTYKSLKLIVLLEIQIVSGFPGTMVALVQYFCHSGRKWKWTPIENQFWGFLQEAHVTQSSGRKLTWLKAQWGSSHDDGEWIVLWDWLTSFEGVKWHWEMVVELSCGIINWVNACHRLSTKPSDTSQIILHWALISTVRCSILHIASIRKSIHPYIHTSTYSTTVQHPSLTYLIFLLILWHFCVLLGWIWIWFVMLAGSNIHQTIWHLGDNFTLFTFNGFWWFLVGWLEVWGFRFRNLGKRVLGFGDFDPERMRADWYRRPRGLLCTIGKGRIGWKSRRRSEKETGWSTWRLPRAQMWRWRGSLVILRYRTQQICSITILFCHCGG